MIFFIGRSLQVHVMTLVGLICMIDAWAYLFASDVLSIFSFPHKIGIQVRPVITNIIGFEVAKLRSWTLAYYESNIVQSYVAFDQTGQVS